MTEGVEVNLGRVEEFPVGGMRIVRAGRLEIGVVRHEGGEIHAVRNRCPHKGAPLCRGAVGGTMLPSTPGDLAYGLEPTVLRCPWHGYEFDLASGKALFGVTELRVRTFPVVVRDDAVHVILPPNTAAETSGEQR
jgi:nitrite reductase/ring-hydroxylating ferredoxin subunit